MFYKGKKRGEKRLVEERIVEHIPSRNINSLGSISSLASFSLQIQLRRREGAFKRKKKRQEVLEEKDTSLTRLIL